MEQRKALAEVTSVSVSDVKTLPEGHTVYLVTLSPNLVSKWCRYSAVCRLRRHLQALLSRQEPGIQLPPLAKGSGFAEPDVVEQRRLACRDFFQAAVSMPTVVSSRIFVAFFDSEGQSSSVPGLAALSLSDSAMCNGFQPTLASPMDPVPPPSAYLCRERSSSIESLPEVPDLTGSDFPDSRSSSYGTALDVLEDTSSSEVIEPVFGVDDQHSSECLSPLGRSPGSPSIWLSRASSPGFDGEDNVKEKEHDSPAVSCSSETVAMADVSLVDLSLIAEEDNRTRSYSVSPDQASPPLSGDSDDEGDSDDVDDVVTPQECHRPSRPEASAGSTSRAAVATSTPVKDPPVPVVRPSRLGLGTGQTTAQHVDDNSSSAAANPSSQSEVDYIVSAARMISRAISSEGKSQFLEAYDLYIGGVGVLLSGVQTDTNAYRRDAVRHKTAQYLHRAGVLQRSHLSDERSNDLHEEVAQLPYRSTSELNGKQSATVRVLSALESPPASLSYLANIHQHSTSLDYIERPVHVGPRLLDYRVLRPVGKCMLVENKYTGDVYLIKSLTKSQSTAHSSSTKRSRCLVKYLCPYMVKPIGHFETASTVFLLLEYAQRGCLWSQLTRFCPSTSTAEGDGCASGAAAGVPEKQVRRWSAQLVVALSHLHLSGFVWQDLQPSNILLSDEGMFLLTYSGVWENVERQYSSWAAKHLFVAPELTTTSATPAADWWSLGVIMFELLTRTSFLSRHPGGMVCYTRPSLPAGLSEASKSLLGGLLQVSPSARLGAGPRGVEEITSHPFFAKIRGWHT